MSPKLPSKVYLGDGVYIAADPLTFGLILTTENGIQTTNRIVLEPEVAVALVKFIERMVRLGGD